MMVRVHPVPPFKGIMTPQEKALKQARKQYGDTAFTEDHVNYRRIGFRAGTTHVIGMGDDWHGAFAQVERKVNDLQRKGVI
jgi:alpha/beta superfamily hydrolase